MTYRDVSKTRVLYVREFYIRSSFNRAVWHIYGLDEVEELVEVLAWG